MKNIIKIKQKLANDWFKLLQDKIVEEFQSLENQFSKNKKHQFKKREWKKTKKK